MGYNEVTATILDIKKQQGEAVEGEYVGSRKIPNKLKPEEPQTVWELEGDDGIKLGLYGFTNLNRAMEAISVGKRIRITYLGKKELQTKFGLKGVHQVKVEVWEDPSSPEPKLEKKDNDLPF